MATINRRNWLKIAGMAGTAAVVGSIGTLANTQPEVSIKANPTDGQPARLSLNENPFGPSERVRKVIVDSLDAACRYPRHTELVKAIAQKEGLLQENIVVTGGSTEGLKAAGLLFGAEKGEIVAPDPTFQALLEYAEQWGAYIHRVPVRPSTLQHDLVAMEQRVTGNTRLVFVCNPNNPTGALLTAGELRDFISSVSKRALVFCDEAYFDYITTPGYPSMVDMVRRNENVIVSRTFSKVFGLAGLRIGYLMARADIAARLRESLMAGTNILAINAAAAALEDHDFYEYSKEQNAKAKQTICQCLNELGLQYLPSHTNFVFFRTGRNIHEINTAMQERGVLVGRPFPPFMDWCRVSTGKPEDVARFTAALKEII